MNAEPQASLSIRATAREQIAVAIQLAQSKEQPLRIRIPFGVYNYNQSRGYTFVRDAAWNLSMPSEAVTVEHVEKYINALGRCIAAIITDGPEGVVAKLGEGNPEPFAEADADMDEPNPRPVDEP